MGIEFHEIEVPDVGKDGLSKVQNDKLLVEMGAGINYLQSEVSNHCSTIREHTKELFGCKEYAGVKATAEAASKQSKENAKLLSWFLKLLIATSVVEGGSIGLIGFKMLNGG